MKVATANGLAWSLEGMGRDSGSVSLAVDPSGHPTFAWAYNNLFFNAKVSTKWSSLTLDRAAVETYVSPSLVYDSAGNPSVSYRVRDNGKGREGVGFASRSGSTWTTTLIDGRPAGAYYTYGFNSLAFDPTDGRPAIAYIDDVNDEFNLDTLKYAKSTDSGWELKTIEFDFVSYGRGSVALSSFAGQPIIADCKNGSVRLVRKQPDTSWTEQLIDAGSRCDLCVSGSNAYVAYISNGQLKLAVASLPVVPTEPTDWTIEVIDADGSSRGKPSLKMSPAGVPYVAYFIRGEIRLAK